MTSTVYILCGIPGSGKSTWCKTHHPELPVVSRDILRAEQGYTTDPDHKKICTLDQEIRITDIEYSLIRKYCEEGTSFIVDDMNITPFWRDHLISTLRSYNTHIIGVNFNTPLEICIERRRGQIDESCMKEIYERARPIFKEDVDEIIKVSE